MERIKKSDNCPRRIIQKWETKLPGIYEDIAGLASAKDKGIVLWPDYCPVPIEAMYSHLRQYTRMTYINILLSAPELVASWGWMHHKNVYNIDTDFAKLIASQSVNLTPQTELPIDILRQLPYPVMYIRADGLFDDARGTQFDGFWYWIEHDINKHVDEIRIQIVEKNRPETIPIVLDLDKTGTVGSCIEKTKKAIKDAPLSVPGIVNASQDMIGVSFYVIQIVAYISALSSTLSGLSPEIIGGSGRNATHIYNVGYTG